MTQPDYLRQIKPEMALDRLPSKDRAAVRAIVAGTATPEQQRRFWRIVVYEVAGIEQIVLSLPGEEAIVNFRAGLRYLGLYMLAQSRLPAEDAETPLEPPARTMTERARRRAAKAATAKG